MPFTKGHKINVGRKHSQEQNLKFSLSQMNEKNPNWKGDNIGYFGVHAWVKTHLPMPSLCQRCNLRPPHDLANITGIYSRGFANWEYMCAKCHWLFDGKSRYFDQTKDMTNRKCSVCGSDKTYIRRTENGRPHWNYINNQLVCGTCYARERRKTTHSLY